MAQNTIISRDIIHKLLDAFCGSHTNFTGNDRFYTATGINCRRWAKLYRGELGITLDELAALCRYLKVDFTAETFARQLNLFEGQA